MTRETQTNLIIVVLLLIAVLGVWMWTQDQDRKAIDRGDYSGCYTSRCSSEITNRLTGH